MAEKKGKAAKAPKRDKRGGGGPPTATRNELAQGRKGKAGGGASPGGLPRVGKGEVGGGDPEGGGLH